jgi:hypothetical protein
MWVERGISGLFFNIVPNDIDASVPPLHELEEPLLVKVGVLGMDHCLCVWFNVFTGGETAPFECPLQSREEVEVAGRQVGTVGGVVQALPTECGNMVDRCRCCVGSRIVMQKDDSCCEKVRFLPSNGIFQSCQCLACPFTMLAGHALFHCRVFNTALRRHHLHDEGCTTHNKQGKLPVDTEHSDTPLRSLDIKWGNLFTDYPTYDHCILK